MSASSDSSSEQASFSGGPATTDVLIYDDLDAEERVRAQGLYAEIVQWAISFKDLPEGIRAAVVNVRSSDQLRSMHKRLLEQFAELKIDPSEPVKWMEFRTFWMRGFVPDPVPIT